MRVLLPGEERVGMGRQVTHHVGWGSGSLRGTASMAGYQHSHLAQARTASSPSGERAPSRGANEGGGAGAGSRRRNPSSPQQKSRRWGGGEMRIV